jgi:hypothetical protein
MDSRGLVPKDRREHHFIDDHVPSGFEGVSTMRRRHFAALLSVAVLAQLSTGCCVVRNTFWRIRNSGCSPCFSNPGSSCGSGFCDTGAGYGAGYSSGAIGYGGTAGYGYAPANYGSPDCTTCSYGNNGGMPGAYATSPNTGVMNGGNIPGAWSSYARDNGINNPVYSVNPGMITPPATTTNPAIPSPPNVGLPMPTELTKKTK